jgi:hypothetical protein
MAHVVMLVLSQPFGPPIRHYINTHPPIKYHYQLSVAGGMQASGSAFNLLLHPRVVVTGDLAFDLCVSRNCDFAILR